MKISTARIDGLMTTSAQKLSLPIQRLRLRVAVLTAGRVGEKARPPVR